MPLLPRSHSHTVPYCDIRLDDNVIILRGSAHESAGALLKGTLAFCITEELPVRSIMLSLVGLKRLQWQEKVPTVSGSAALRPVKSEKVVYEKKWEFLEFAHKHPVTLGPNNYEYGFDVALPGDLPESLEGLEDAAVFYRLKAVISRPRFAHNITAKKHLRIVRTLGSGALELSQTVCIENVWPEKIRYSISTPAKAVVFGTSILIDITVVPLAKGITVRRVTCSLNELHTFAIPEKCALKSDLKSILKQPLLSGHMETDDDEDFGTWRLQERFNLPKSLIQCVQDCEIDAIKVRHKLRFIIQLQNPDGHFSELRACLPVQLFISPNLLMDEDNIIHDARRADDPTLNESNAPPPYDDRCLNRLYQDIPHDHFESALPTPAHSGANTPTVLSRQNSLDNIVGLSSMGPGRVSDSDSPTRNPHAGSHRLPSRGGVTPPLVPAAAATAMEEEILARLNRGGIGTGDYVARSLPTSGEGTPHQRSRPSTRAHSPDGPRGPGALGVEELSKVPSYTTAVRAGTRNLEPASSLLTYEDNGFAGSPVGRPPSPRSTPPTTPGMNPGRSGNDGHRSRILGRSHNHGSSNPGSGGSVSSLLAEAERRLRLLQPRGR